MLLTTSLDLQGALESSPSTVMAPSNLSWLSLLSLLFMPRGGLGLRVATLLPILTLRILSLDSWLDLVLGTFADLKLFAPLDCSEEEETETDLIDCPSDPWVAHIHESVRFLFLFPIILTFLASVA